MTARKLFITLWLVGISSGIACIFWHQEVKYVLPTAVPENYQPVPLLSKFMLPEAVKPPVAGKAVFLHFFNPDCPCSRFNVKHFNELAATYGAQVLFKAVIPEGVEPAAAKEFLPAGLPVIVDKGDSLATMVGVYSTPQAVLMNEEGKLYYRGNYNKARYCTQKESNYAELALINFLEGKAPNDYGLFSSRAYGCEFAEVSSLKFLIF